MKSVLKVSCFGAVLCFCECDSLSYAESNIYTKDCDKFGKSAEQSSRDAIFLQQSMKNSKKSNKKNKLMSEQIDQVFMNRPSKFFTTGKVLTRKAINKHIASKIDRFLTVKTLEIEWTAIKRNNHDPFEPKWWQELRNGFGIRGPVEPKWEKITRRRENGR